MCKFNVGQKVKINIRGYALNSKTGIIISIHQGAYYPYLIKFSHITNFIGFQEKELLYFRPKRVINSKLP